MPSKRNRRVRRMRSTVPRYIVHYLETGVGDENLLDEKFDKLDLYLADRDMDETLREAWAEAGPEILRRCRNPWALGEFGPPGEEG